MRLIRIEKGHYKTSCGQYETWKADDGVRSHGGPVWLIWRKGLVKDALADKAGSLLSARRKIERLLHPREERG